MPCQGAGCHHHASSLTSAASSQKCQRTAAGLGQRQKSFENLKEEKWANSLAIKSGVSQNEDWDILIANVINVPKQDKTFYSDVGLVIVDEIHTICTNSFSKSLLHLFPRYLIGLSATPFRTDGMDKILELFCGPEVVYNGEIIASNQSTARHEDEIGLDRR